MNPITIPNITIPVIGLPTIGIPSVGFPSASGGGLVWPKGLKESIKAIYDPASQGMTNYDVIEAYVEDFTYWTLDNTGITSTPKKIVIPTGTELKYAIAFRGFNSFTAGFDIKYTGNAVITYRYNKEDGTVGTIAIDKSGIYHLPASVRVQKNFGFYCNPQTVTEEATIEQLPTSILKDLSGNGNHAYLYGGKGKLNSGMGVYQEDFTTYEGAYVTKHNIIELTKNKRQATKPYSVITKNIESYVIEVTGIISETLQYGYRDETGVEKIFYIKKDGIYTLPKCYKDGTTGTSTGFISYNIAESNIITITQIPDYPNQLCYDGKMYAVCYGFPILEDYAVMADRTWFIEQLSNWTGVLSSNAYSGYTEERGFIFEYNAENNKVQNNSFGTNNLNTRHQDGISYMTKTSYNGNSINSGDLKGVDFLTIGAFVDKDTLKGSYNWKGCHGKIIIADRSFTEDEITWLKDNWKKI